VGRLARLVPDLCLVSGWPVLLVGCVGLGRVFWIGSGVGSKIIARARPMECCGSKTLACTRPLH
jgi:hypothetical protein